MKAKLPDLLLKVLFEDKHKPLEALFMTMTSSAKLSYVLVWQCFEVFSALT